MKTVFTAVGHFYTRRNQDGSAQAVVFAGGEEHRLDETERVLWGTLLWQISTMEDLKNVFAKRQKEGEPPTDVDYYIHRLITRGLVARGEGKNHLDAYYEMLKSLHVIPQSQSFLYKVLAFIAMLLHGYPLRTACHVFRRFDLSPYDRAVLDLATQKEPATTAELICDVEAREEHKAAPAPAEEARQSKYYNGVICSISNLYRRRWILFDHA